MLRSQSGGMLLMIPGLLLLLAALMGCNAPATSAPNTPSPAPTAEPDTGMTIVPRTESPEPTATLEFSLIRPRQCLGAPASRLIIHERGRVVDDGEGLNLREAPGLDNDIRTKLESGEVFYVLDGPECVEEYAWYRVQTERYTGWIAEGESDEYYVEPHLPG
jgi:uncharacterized protein YgiM (DUF1202 family)